MVPPKRLLAGSLVLAAAVRCYLLWQYYCISSDGVVYLRAAQEFFHGNFKDALASVYPPGYPLLITVVYPMIGDWELAGQIVSLLAGVGLLLPLYGIFHQVFNARVAIVACYLAAISPFLALYSAHVRSESVYLVFSASALLLFLRGRKARSSRCYFFGGMVAGFAYLIRPEAVGFLVIVAVVEVVLGFFDGNGKLTWILRTMTALSIGFLIFSLPYIVYLSVDTGRFGAISRKAGVTLAINLKEAGLLDDEAVGQAGDVDSLVFTDYVVKHPILYARKVIGDFVPAVGVFFQALHYPFVPFLLLGLVLAVRERFWQKSELLLVMVVLVYVLGFTLFYVKRRYSLQAVPVALAWVAWGVIYCWDRLRQLFPVKKAAWIAAAVALIVLGTTLPKTLKPVSREKAYVRDAGWYLKSRNPTGKLAIAVVDDRVTFYAGARTVLLTKQKSADVRDYLRHEKVDFFAIESRVFAKLFPEIYRNPEAFGLVYEREFVGTRRDRMMLFKVT